MLDPSENWLSRTVRWGFLAFLILGIPFLNGTLSWQGLGTAISYGITAMAAALLAKSIIVDPIQAKIRALETKIDWLNERLTGRRDWSDIA